jgi:two-component system sensor histidine kinase KdpD
VKTHSVGARPSARAAFEVVASIAAASLLVAALDRIAPITGLTVVYLLAVLFVAIRHGEVAGLVTAALSVLTMNFFFIEPRYRLTITESDHVVTLAVFLVVAVVVGRLAASARERAEESSSRAEIADAREREAVLLAEAASLMLVGDSLEAELDRIGQSLAPLLGAGARIELAAVPTAGLGQRAVRLSLAERAGWLYVAGDADRAAAERVAEPLSRLIDVGLERRKLGEQASDAEARRRAEAARTAVLHAVSHDLRSPLTAILTAGEGLQRNDLSPNERAELLSVVQGEGRRLSRLVGDLLDLSRIQAGAVDPRRDWCDLRDVVTGAAEQVRLAHGDHPIEIELPDDLPLVRADSVQLERVFANLIENAVKFSPDGVPVTISGALAPAGVTVRVRDRGQGIPPGRREHIFEPFFRGREGPAGSGLGLAICRGFVEANGGRISLQTRKGEGTAFAVTFPLAERAPEPAPVP